jgi:hypothetical protein
MHVIELPPRSAARSSDLMRDINLQLSGEFDTGHQVGFFCECSDMDCYAVVWRSAAAFDAHVAQAASGWLLAPGH